VAFVDEKRNCDGLLAKVEPQKRIDAGGKESLFLIKRGEPGVVLGKETEVEVLGLVAKFFADGVEKLPESRRRFLQPDDIHKFIASEGLVPLELDAGNLEAAPSLLRLRDDRKNDAAENNIDGSIAHGNFKKKPSHETLGSILALYFIVEGNLT
jgi:hypothetical protein